MIVSSQTTLHSEIVDAEIASLNRADEDFDKMLDRLTSTQSNFQNAAVNDRELLLLKAEEYYKKIVAK